MEQMFYPQFPLRNYTDILQTQIAHVSFLSFSPHSLTLSWLTSNSNVSYKAQNGSIFR